MLRILVAIDSFKGSLPSVELARCVERGIKNIIPETDIIKIPIADGGEGTVDALVLGTGGHKRQLEVTGPLGEKIIAEYGIIKGNTAVIEMAAASGLPLVPENKRDPRKTTSYGTGELIRTALKDNCQKIIMGIGGSATNDGGVGMAQALGISFKNADNQEIGFGGQELEHLHSIDTSGILPQLKKCGIVIASDVSNPLCGPEGASIMYGPQKGATPETIEILDRNLQHYANIIKKDCGKDIAVLPGAGAAGGLAVPLLAYGCVDLQAGIDIVFETLRFEQCLENVNLVITGEGRIDKQSVFGKVPVGVAKLAKKQGIPVIAIVGSEGDGAEEVYATGIDVILAITNRPMSLTESMESTSTLVTGAAERIGRFLKLGICKG